MNKYSDKEYEIFSRLFILKEFAKKNLDKLSKINVAIVGLGGIGCPLSQYLVNSGIKNLKLVDGDVVEKSNLNRQILFNSNDIGKKKVMVAREKLNGINAECQIAIQDKNIELNNINFLSNCSIIVDATDDWQSSKLLNKFCLQNSINFLFTSVVGHDIQVALFENLKTKSHVCLNCIFPNENDINLPRCETVGISGISSGIAGLIAAQKIINFYLNLNDETNLLTISNGKKLTIENIVIKSNHNCNLK